MDLGESVRWGKWKFLDFSKTFLASASRLNGFFIRKGTKNRWENYLIATNVNNNFNNFLQIILI